MPTDKTVVCMRGDARVAWDTDNKHVVLYLPELTCMISIQILTLSGITKFEVTHNESASVFKPFSDEYRPHDNECRVITCMLQTEMNKITKNSIRVPPMTRTQLNPREKSRDDSRLGTRNPTTKTIEVQMKPHSNPPPASSIPQPAPMVLATSTPYIASVGRPPQVTPVSSKTAAVPSQLKWTGYNPAPISALMNLTTSIVPETTAPRAEPLNLVKAISVPPAFQHETVQYKIVHAHVETKNKRQLKDKKGSDSWTVVPEAKQLHEQPMDKHIEMLKASSQALPNSPQSPVSDSDKMVINIDN